MRKNFKAIERVTKNNSQWVSVEKEKVSDLAPFKDLVNCVVEKLGLEFRLKISSDGQRYIIFGKNANSADSRGDFDKAPDY